MASLIARTPPNIYTIGVVYPEPRRAGKGRVRRRSDTERLTKIGATAFLATYHR